MGRPWRGASLRCSAPGGQGRQGARACGRARRAIFKNSNVKTISVKSRLHPPKRAVGKWRPERAVPLMLAPRPRGRRRRVPRCQGAPRLPRERWWRRRRRCSLHPSQLLAHAPTRALPLNALIPAPTRGLLPIHRRATAACAGPRARATTARAGSSDSSSGCSSKCHRSSSRSSGSSGGGGGGSRCARALGGAGAGTHGLRGERALHARRVQRLQWKPRRWKNMERGCSCHGVGRGSRVHLAARQPPPAST